LLHPDEVVNADDPHSDPIQVDHKGARAHPGVGGGAWDFIQDVQLTVPRG
jgi:hypothetical protein